MGAPTAQRAQQPGSCLVGLGKPAPKLDEKTELFVCLEAAVHVVGCYNIVRGHVIGAVSYTHLTLPTTPYV